MPTKNSAAPQLELIEVVLVKAHTHKREALEAGAKIKVTADQKSWLEKNGIVSSAD